MDRVVHFLLVFDNATGLLIREDTFDNPEAAATAYSDAEKTYVGKSDVEVVLVGADARETLLQTHGHYFGARQGDPDGYLSLVW